MISRFTEKIYGQKSQMTKFNVADSDPLKYLSPSNADKCWRELVKAQHREHVFKPAAGFNSTQGSSPYRDSEYRSTFSASKGTLRKLVRSTEEIPPAGRPSFFKESRRPELEHLSRNAEYQSILAEHMRNNCSSARSTTTTNSSKQSHRTL